MTKVGVIGLGRQGMLHLLNCFKIDDVKVVAVADPSKKALKKAESLGVDKLYSDYHDLFSHSSDLDAVILSLPNSLHFESIKLALENGLNVFAEKPMATSVDECREIVKSVDKSSRKFMVGHVMRFVDSIVKMKEILDEGQIGELEVATIEEIINGPFSHPRVPAPVSDWWFDPKISGGGALLDIGYHMIDLFRYFAGDSNVEFSSLNHRFNMRVEDGAIVMLKSSKGSAKGIINVGWYEQTTFPKFNFRTLLHGTAGYLSSDDFTPRNIYTNAVKESVKNIGRRVSGRKIHYLSYTYHYESFYKELASFFNCLENDSCPPVSAIDGLRAIEIIQDAYKKSN